MSTKIKCPHCSKEFEPTDAWKHELEEELGSSIAEKYKVEIEKVRIEATKDASEKLSKELQTEKESSQKLREQLSDLIEETRKLRQKDENREIEMKKKLLDEEEKIRSEVKRKTEEEHKLKDFEKDKKLSDALDQIESLKKKIQQGSQQIQGESLELEIETRLREEFPTDNIIEVKKGQRGADIAQEVFDKLGRRCGVILWESKNAAWSDGWVSKLKEDQRQAKADISVLVSVNTPPGVESFVYRDGVWICSWKHFLPLSWTLRYNLVSVFHERQSNIGKDEKMQILYEYLTGKEFVHRVEAIADSFSSMQDELEREKRFFNTKWARQEKQIRKVIDHTLGMWGDLQGVMGKNLPEIKSLELESGEILD